MVFDEKADEEQNHGNSTNEEAKKRMIFSISINRSLFNHILG